MAPAGDSRVRPRRKRIWRALGVLFGLALITAGAVGLGFLPQDRLRSFAETQLRAVFGPQSRIGRLHVVPGRLLVEMEDLVVEGPAFRMELPEVRAQAATAVLLGRPVLRSLHLTRPRLLVKASVEPVSKEGGTPGPIPPILIQSLTIDSGAVVYRDAALEGDLSLDALEVSGSVGVGLLEARAAGGRWARADPWTFGPLSTRMRLSPTLDLHLETFEVAAGSSRLHAEGAVGPVTAPDLDLRATLHLSLSDLPAVPNAPPLAGTLEATAEARGTLDALAAQVTASGRGMQLGAETVESLQVELTHETEGLRTQGRGEARLRGGTVHVTGERKGEHIEANVRVAELHGEDMGPLRGTTVSGSATARGTLEALQLTAKLKGTTRHAEGVSYTVDGDARGTLSPPAGEVSLDWQAVIASTAAERSARLRAHGHAGPVSPLVVDAEMQGTLLVPATGAVSEVPVHGTVAAQGEATAVRMSFGGPDETPAMAARLVADLQGRVVRDLQASGTCRDLARLAPGAAGRAEFALSASGPLDRLSAQGTAVAEEVAWQGVRVGRSDWTLQARNGHGRLEGRVPEWQVTAAVDGDARRVKGHVSLAGTPLAPLAPLLPPGEPLEGRLDGELTFDLPPDRPDQGTARLNLTASGVKRGPTEAVIHKPLVAVWEKGVVRIEDFEATAAGVTVAASGRLGTEATSPLDLDLRVRSDLAALPPHPRVRPSGSLEADVRVQGTRLRPVLQGSADLRGLEVVAAATGEPLLAMEEARITLDRDTATLLPAHAEVAGGTLRLSGAVPVGSFTDAAAGGGQDLQFEATWRGIQAGRWMEAFAPAGEPTEATVAGEIRVSGPVASPSRLEGVLRLEATEIRRGDLRFTLEAIDARVTGGHLTLPRLVLRSSAGTLEGRLAADLHGRTLDAAANGRVALRALSAFIPDAALDGEAELNVAVSGPFDAPQTRGRIVLDEVAVRYTDLPQALTDLSGRVELEGTSFRLVDVTGRLGGGAIAASGGGRLAGGTVADLDIRLSGKDISTEYPEGFRSRVGAEVTVTGGTDLVRVGGNVRLVRGLFDRDINIEDMVLSPEAPPAARAPTATTIPIDLDLVAVVEDRVVVRNNLAELDVSGRLILRGTTEAPAPFGRLEVRRGGKIFLQTREYAVTRGSLTYTGTLDPEISVEAETSIAQAEGDVKVTVTLTGPLLKPEIDLRSEPSYTEAEIVSLVTTGRRAIGQDRAWIAGEQAAALLAGRVTRSLSRSLSHLGLDQVDIQPQLLAREADPAVRFTFGKSLTPQVRLLYSVGLNDAEDQFAQAEYRLRWGRQVRLKVRRDADGTIGYGAGQRLRFGGERRAGRTGRRTQTTLADVEVKGTAPLPPKDLADLLPKAGDETNEWELQDKADQLQKRLTEAGYLEALVGVQLENAVASFDVRTGMRYGWEVRGMIDPPPLDRVVGDAPFETEALRRGRDRLLETAHARGFWRARVDTTSEDDDGTRTLVFTVVLGEQMALDAVLFPGAKALPQERLIQAAGGVSALMLRPTEARKKIVEAYHAEFYLAAEAEPPRVEPAPPRNGLPAFRIVMPIREGEKAVLRAVRFDGASLPIGDLTRIAGIPIGAPYNSVASDQALLRLREHYLEKGYAGIRVLPRLEPEGPDLALVFYITEGDLVRVGEVMVTGLRRTQRALVDRKMAVKAGEPFDPRMLARIERRLLDLGVFQRVAATSSSDNPTTITVEVEEQGPYAVSYDALYSNDEGLTGLADVEHGNLGGRALALGMRYRAGRDLREARTSFHVPSIGRFGDLTATLSWLEEDFLLLRERVVAPAEAEGATEVRRGLQVQQSLRFGDRWDFLYGYRFRRVTDKRGRFRQDVGAIDASVLRDTRDDPLNARRGRFLSFSLEAGTPLLGSDFGYFKAFGQAFFARPIGEKWTWAQGYRLGAAQGITESQLQAIEVFGRSSELFRAGGANSLRGFASDSIGPPGPIPGLSRGGEALIVLNQEIRYELPFGTQAAAFYDGGNLFATISDAGLGLRHSLGVGARYESPIGLLRLDVAWPLAARRREGMRWYLSLGQAF